MRPASAHMGGWCGLFPGSLGQTDTCRESIAVVRTKYVQAISLGTFNGEEAVSFDRRIALATRNSDQKFNFQHKAPGGPRQRCFLPTASSLGCSGPGREGREGGDGAFQVSDSLSLASGARRLSVSAPE